MKIAVKQNNCVEIFYNMLIIKRLVVFNDELYKILTRIFYYHLQSGEVEYALGNIISSLNCLMLYLINGIVLDCNEKKSFPKFNFP